MEHYFVVPTIKGRIAMNKQESHKLHMERFSLKNLNEVECTERYRVEVSNRCAVLEDLDAGVEISSAWETNREKINISTEEGIGYYEMKQH
jgi:hypothetical protein